MTENKYCAIWTPNEDGHYCHEFLIEYLEEKIDVREYYKRLPQSKKEMYKHGILEISETIFPTNDRKMLSAMLVNYDKQNTTIYSGR